MSKLLVHRQGPPQHTLRLSPLVALAPRLAWGSQKNSAMRWTMPSRFWTVPVAPGKLEVLTSTTFSSDTWLQTTTFTNPVSSPRVMKTTPEAVPGRCLHMTILAYATAISASLNLNNDTKQCPRVFKSRFPGHGFLLTRLPSILNSKS
jgi:hypothetical protein